MTSTNEKTTQEAKKKKEDMEANKEWKYKTTENYTIKIQFPLPPSEN